MHLVKWLEAETSAGPAAGADQIVQSIDRLTMVTTMLVAATKEQTQQQGMIASAQMQQSEKLARQAKASAEEAALEKGGDFSGNSAYALLGAGGAGGGRAGFVGGGGPGFGLGGKVLAKNMLGAATKRGAARTGTRLGAALGGRMLGGFGARMGAKLGSKSVGKGLITLKRWSKMGKKIPSGWIRSWCHLCCSESNEGRPPWCWFGTSIWCCIYSPWHWNCWICWY